MKKSFVEELPAEGLSKTDLYFNEQQWALINTLKKDKSKNENLILDVNDSLLCKSSLN